jgi:hypothetical protein
VANLTIPTTSVPGTHQQQGSNIINAIRRGAIKFLPIHYYYLPIAYTDFTGAGAVLTIDRVVSTQWPNRKFPANVHPLENPAPIVDLEEEFAGGAVATCVLDAGNAGDLDGLVDAVNVFTGAGTGIKDAKNDTGTDLYDFQAALNMTVTLTTTVANLDQLTSGKATIYIPCTAVPRSKA